jgi:hypothetical protein
VAAGQIVQSPGKPRPVDYRQWRLCVELRRTARSGWVGAVKAEDDCMKAHADSADLKLTDASTGHAPDYKGGFGGCEDERSHWLRAIEHNGYLAQIGIVCYII